LSVVERLGSKAVDEGARFDHCEALIEGFADGGLVGEFSSSDGPAHADDGGGQGARRSAPDSSATVPERRSSGSP
jgi:hypothetical protein